MYTFFVPTVVDQLTVIAQADPPMGLSFFWQLIATTFGIILLWLFQQDLSRRTKREEKMAESISTLKTNVAVLTSDVEKIREDMNQLLGKK